MFEGLMYKVLKLIEQTILYILWPEPFLDLVRVVHHSVGAMNPSQISLVVRRLVAMGVPKETWKKSMKHNESLFSHVSK